VSESFFESNQASDSNLAKLAKTRSEYYKNMAEKIGKESTVLEVRKGAEAAKAAADVLTAEAAGARAAADLAASKTQLFDTCMVFVKKFRRSEYSSLSDKNFNTNLFLLTDVFTIEALNISVKGKKTNRKERRNENDTYACWRKLWILGIREVHELCQGLLLHCYLPLGAIRMEDKQGVVIAPMVKEPRDKSANPGDIRGERLDIE
jgi:hypothetical protein